ncbi:MAG: oligosaccharide flippase family protein [Pseudomonadota bacterium]
MSSLRGNLLIALASSNTTLAINFIASLALARLLTPEEIGIFSVAFVLASLFRTLREMGLGAYIVQETDLTPARFRTALGLSFLVSFACGLIVALLAESAGQFYREPRVTMALYVIALTFLVVPIGATSMSMMTRGMRFKEIALVEIFSALVQSSTGIYLAWQGQGFLSLAWASLAGICASSLAVMYFRAPGLPWLPALKEWRHVLRFSGYVSGSSLLTYANQSASDLVLGRMMGMEAVAFFNRAHGLTSTFTTVLLKAVNAVSLSHHAQQHRQGIDSSDGFFHSTTLIAMIAIPLYAWVAVLSQPIILLLYGPQWTPAAHLLAILSLVGMASALESQIRPFMTAHGHVKALMLLDTRILALKLAVLVLGALHSLEAVAWGYALASVLGTTMRFHTLRCLVPLGKPGLGPILRHTLLTSLGSIIGPIMVILWAPVEAPSAMILLAALAALAGWIATVITTTNPMRDEALRFLHRQRRS